MLHDADIHNSLTSDHIAYHTIQFTPLQLRRRSWNAERSINSREFND